MAKVHLILLCLLLSIAVINIGLASAQVAPEWTFGPGWNGADIPTPTPEPSSTPTSTPTSNPLPTPLNIVTNTFIASLGALGMFAVVPIISSAGLIITIVMMMRSGEEIDPKIITAGVILVIAVNIFAVVGILIINGVNTAMPATQFLHDYFFVS